MWPQLVMRLFRAEPGRGGAQVEGHCQSHLDVYLSSMILWLYREYGTILLVMMKAPFPSGSSRCSGHVGT